MMTPTAWVTLGDTITYTYSVATTGTANLTGVTVVDDSWVR
jgi:uncharacterized repeat protein (TIGR01451 family)